MKEAKLFVLMMQTYLSYKKKVSKYNAVRYCIDLVNIPMVIYNVCIKYNYSVST